MGSIDLAKLRILFESAGFGELSSQIKQLDAQGNSTFAGIQHAATASMGEITRVTGEAMSAVGASLMGVLALAIHAAGEQEDAQAQLTAVLKSTGGAAGMTAEQLNKMAEEMSHATTFQADMITGGQAMGLTFTNISKDVFPRFTQDTLDLSVGMNHGHASAEALQSATIELGKAMNDPIQGVTALHRIGVELNEQQKAQINLLMGNTEELGHFKDAADKAKDSSERWTKDLEVARVRLQEMQASGNASTSSLMSQRNQIEELQKNLTHAQAAISQYSDAQKQSNANTKDGSGLLKAQQIILAEVEKEFGGRAVAAADTFDGKIIQLKNAFHDLLEELGSLLSDGKGGMKSFVVQTTAQIKATAEWVGAHKELTTSILHVAGAFALLMTVLGPIAIAYNTFLPIVTALIGLFGGGSAAAGLAGAATAATAGVEGAGVAAVATAATLNPLTIAIGAVVGGFAVLTYGVYKVAEAHRELEKSEQRLQGLLDTYVAKLRAKGQYIDADVLKNKSAAAQIEAIHAEENRNLDSDLHFYLERLTTKESADRQFQLAKTLSLNKEMTTEEAAKASIQGLTEQANMELLQADEQHTNAMLTLLGIRTAQTEMQTAQSEQNVQNTIQDFSLMGFQTRDTGWRMTSDSMHEHYAALGRTVDHFTAEEAEAVQKSMDSAKGLADAHDTSIAATQADFDKIKAADQAMGAAFDENNTRINVGFENMGEVMAKFEEEVRNMPLNVGTSSAEMAAAFEQSFQKIADGADEALKHVQALDPSVRHSPSVNDRIEAALMDTTRLFSVAFGTIGGLASATREALASNLSAALPASFKVATSVDAASVLNRSLPQSPPPIGGVIHRPGSDIPQTQTHGPIAGGKYGGGVTINMNFGPGAIRESADVGAIFNEMERQIQLRMALEGGF